MKVNLVGGQKGGNPGGMCEVSNGVPVFKAYFKYVYGNRNSKKNSSFTAAHQPVYEGLTFQLARELGLRTPNTFLLLNRAHDTQFENWSKHLDKDPSGREYYFVSKLVPHPQREQPDDREQAQLERQRPYLEALMISDIIGRAPNYSFIPFNGTGQTFYLDLGCSFVHATQGFLTMPHKLQVAEQKQFKRNLKRLKGQRIVSDDGREVDLGVLVEELGDLRIPTLNPLGRIPIREIISSPEIEEIQGYLLQSFMSSLKLLEERGLLC